MSQGGQEPVFTIGEYQASAKETDVIASRPLTLPLLGLFGEIGSLLSELKKKQRDEDSYVGYKSSVIEELGDVLWYFACICNHTSISMEQVARVAFSCCLTTEEPLTFSCIQKKAKAGATMPADLEKGLLRLSGEAGKLMIYHVENPSEDRNELSSHMTDVLKAIVAVANQAQVSLAVAADRNLKKIHDRWPKNRIYPPLFDERFSKEEQLPRRIRISILEKTIGGRTYVYQKCNDVNIGDRLTDNIQEEDDYRFHDVFHLGFAAVLGWSPVTRALFKVKRKSNPKVDENEDGARAIIVEEAISAWIFNRAAQLNYLEGLKALDYGLLKAVRSLARGYEVYTCPLWVWEEAILEGYTVFRQLRLHRRGVVMADLKERTITFRAIDDETY